MVVLGDRFTEFEVTEGSDLSFYAEHWRVPSSQHAILRPAMDKLLLSNSGLSGVERGSRVLVISVPQGDNQVRAAMSAPSIVVHHSRLPHLASLRPP